jgi:hypothetical protein
MGYTGYMERFLIGLSVVLIGFGLYRVLFI